MEDIGGMRDTVGAREYGWSGGYGWGQSLWIWMELVDMDEVCGVWHIF